MKICKKLAVLLLCLLAVVSCFPLSAQAAGSIDLTHACVLSLSYQDNGTPLSGAPFTLYRVADVDANGNLTATGAFARFPVDIRGKNDAAWNTLATTLESYVLRDQVPALDRQTTDGAGNLTFAEQTPGLYLVLGSRHTQNGRYYDAAPFLTLLPALNAEQTIWVYTVTANVKFDSEPVPENPAEITRSVQKIWKDAQNETARPKEISVQLLRDGTIADTVTLSAENSWHYTWAHLDGASRWHVVETAPNGYTVEITRDGDAFEIVNTDTTHNPPPENHLPQTGQLWWPVPVLIAAGLALLALGLLARRRRHETA